MSEQTLDEQDCALMRTHAHDLRCAVARLWVLQPCPPTTHHASSVESCVDDLMALTNKICSIANKTCAPSKECSMDDAA